MNDQPPKWAIRFLRWFCRRDFIEEIEGDLVELYEKRAKHSITNARMFFLWNVLRSLRLVNIKRISYIEKNTTMLRSYMKIGYRSITKDWKFSTLNLFGLSIGLAIFTIMLLMLNHELTFDKFHTKGDRIFHVIQEFHNSDGPDPEIFTSVKLSEALRNEFSYVENAVTVHGASDSWVEIGNERFFETEGIVAGTQFFELFDFAFVSGTAETALDQSRSIVLTEELAIKYFGSKDPMGEVLNVERYGLFTVTGILESIPSNSYIQFDFILTQDYDVYFTQVSPRFPAWFMSWRGDPAATYVLLESPEQAANFSEDMQILLSKHLDEGEAINRHFLINLWDLHFGSNGIDGRVNRYVKGDLRQIKTLAGIAFLILAMASFNYINITTSRSVKRSKEVGIRKSIGAFRTQLMGQFLTESLLMVLIALTMSFAWTYLLLPYFASITGIAIDFGLTALLKIVPFLGATVIFVTLLAGFYPAIYLGRFSAIQVLKNSVISVKGNVVLRNSLITVQYVLVILMLASLLVINRQYNYFSNRPIGFDTEQLVIVEVNGGGVRSNFNNLKNELLSSPQISKVTGLTRMISGYRSGESIFTADIDNPELFHPMRFYGMDSDGIETLGLSLNAGADFTGNHSYDSSTVFLNETAAALYGNESIIGNYITIRDDEDDVRFTARVGGILQDFHYRSLHDPIGPLVVGYLNNPFQGLDDIVIRIQGGNISQTLAHIEEVHNKFDENDVMTWEFMDDMMQRAYEKESMFQKVFAGASSLAIVIAILGMVGLISYNVTSRIKEIGIRKVFGATFFQILFLQGKSFVKFIVVAAVISFPIALWQGEQWLNNYAFRINLPILPFAGIMLLILLITSLVVYLVCFKAAKESPIKALRYE